MSVSKAGSTGCACSLAGCACRLSASCPERPTMGAPPSAMGVGEPFGAHVYDKEPGFADGNAGAGQAAWSKDPSVGTREWEGASTSGDGGGLLTASRASTSGGGGGLSTASRASTSGGGGGLSTASRAFTSGGGGGLSTASRGPRALAGQRACSRSQLSVRRKVPRRVAGRVVC